MYIKKKIIIKYSNNNVIQCDNQITQKNSIDT